MNRRFSLSVEQQGLVKSAWPGLRRLARSVARRHETDNADDLAQLGVLKAVELVTSYDAGAGASFDTFIFRTARRVMVAACLVERRERLVSARAARRLRAELGTGEVSWDDDGEGGDWAVRERDDVGVSAVAAMFSAPETPERLLALAEERAWLSQRVDEAMARLSSRDRAVVRACACDGESVAAAARRVGVGYHQARYGLTVAMASLGKWLKAAA